MTSPRLEESTSERDTVLEQADGYVETRIEVAQVLENPGNEEPENELWGV